MAGNRISALFVALALLAGASAAPGLAQQADGAAPARPENVMKACGDRWRAVKETDAAKGVTWTQYLSRCRAEMAARAPAPPSPAGAQAAPAPSATGQEGAPPRRARSASAAQPQGGAAVFPTAVSPRHAGEKPHRARQKTCSDQFKANKASGANGGLRWVQKGGGYWSQCNARLKQAGV